MSEKVWFLIPVLAVISAIALGLVVNTSIQLEKTKAELEMALTSTDEYMLSVDTSVDAKAANISVLGWPSLNETAVTAPITVEVILPQGIEHIAVVNRNELADSTTYSIVSNAGYPDRGISTITFKTASADHFDLLLGQSYAKSTSGMGFVTIWANGTKIQEPVKVYIDHETDFAIRIDLTTTNKA